MSGQVRRLLRPCPCPWNVLWLGHTLTKTQNLANFTTNPVITVVWFDPIDPKSALYLSTYWLIILQNLIVLAKTICSWRQVDFIHFMHVQV